MSTLGKGYKNVGDGNSVGIDAIVACIQARQCMSGCYIMYQLWQSTCQDLHIGVMLAILGNYDHGKPHSAFILDNSTINHLDHDVIHPTLACRLPNKILPSYHQAESN